MVANKTKCHLWRYGLIAKRMDSRTDKVDWLVCTWSSKIDVDISTQVSNIECQSKIQKCIHKEIVIQNQDFLSHVGGPDKKIIKLQIILGREGVGGGEGF